MYGMIPFGRRHNDLSRGNDIRDLRNLFDSFFEEGLMPAFFTAGNGMKTDVRETEKEYVVEAELPGVKKEDIRLDLRDELLTVSVERREESNEERSNYIRRERKYGSVSRSFHVENINHEAVTAKYSDGILTITLPKLAEGKERKHNIEIQ